LIKEGFMMSDSMEICIIIILCVIGFSFIPGCVNQHPGQTSVKIVIPPDPESGIHHWINAINNKNVSRLYDLTPAVIKKQVTEEQFKLDNQDNLILKPGLTFKQEFTEITESVTGANATIKAQLILQNLNKGNESMSEIPVQYVFYLSYENGEWKVWT